MHFNLPPNPNKENVFEAVGEHLEKLSLKVADVDTTKPWGGAYYIEGASTDAFIEAFFPEVNREDLYRYGEELSPKILIVGPDEKLSWQYHNRRAETWKTLTPVGIMDSNTDTKPDTHTVLNTGEIIQHGNQVRHRLIGLDEWGVIAEIWQHTVPGNPSTEEDIVRLEDNYGRN